MWRGGKRKRERETRGCGSVRARAATATATATVAVAVADVAHEDDEDGAVPIYDKRREELVGLFTSEELERQSQSARREREKIIYETVKEDTGAISRALRTPGLAAAAAAAAAAVVVVEVVEVDYVHITRKGGRREPPRKLPIYYELVFDV